MSYGDYVEQLTYLLFLKVIEERAQAAYNQASPVSEIQLAELDEEIRRRAPTFDVFVCVLFPALVADQLAAARHGTRVSVPLRLAGSVGFLREPYGTSPLPVRE